MKYIYKAIGWIIIILIMGILTEGLISCKATQYITINNHKTVNNGTKE